MNKNVEQWTIRKPAVASNGGAVASQHWLAANSGASMLRRGGNATDAAVACAIALNVVEPWMCGLGGSGYLVHWDAKQKTARAINFQGVAAGKIRHEDYPLDPETPDSLMGFPGVKNRRNEVGYCSITVPGAVAGMAHALRHFGTLSWDQVLVPAIDLARKGLPVDWHVTLNTALEAHDLAKEPETSRIFLPGGHPPQPEQYLQLGRLQETLERLADAGPEDFYRGRLAGKIAEDLQNGGSSIRADDLAAYTVQEHESLCGIHRGTELHTAGKTSGGPRMLDTLKHVQQNLDCSKGFGAETYRVYGEGLNLAFRAHRERMGITAETGCTSHISAIDQDGNAAALTYTLLNRFGSKVVLPQTGLLMNNAVSYFDPRPGFPTSLEGGIRINSSNMCPTIAVLDGQALFSVGASGANHIVPCTTQIAGFLIDYGFSLEEVFHLPRIDAWGVNEIRVDPAAGEKVIAELRKHFTLEIAQRLVFPKLYACPSAVMRDPTDGKTYSISDPTNPSASGAAE